MNLGPECLGIWAMLSHGDERGITVAAPKRRPRFL